MKLQSFKNFIKPAKKVIAIYPGRFQTPHKGHLYVYNYLTTKFDDVYIATSNKTELPKSPFTFEEKKKLLTFIGIPANKIIETKVPNLPKEITEKLPEDSAIVIGAGIKVQEEEQRFKFQPLKNGKPSYYQPYEGNESKLMTFTNHAYILFLPTFKFIVRGKEIKSASEIRKMFKESTYSQQKALIIELYGKYDKSIHDILEKLNNLP